MSHNSYFIVIHIIYTGLSLIIKGSGGIVSSPGKSIERLRADIGIKHNPLSRILDGVGLTNHEEFNCTEEWQDYNLTNVLICYCKDRGSKVDISNDANNKISPGWETINSKVIHSQQDMISQLYLLNCSYTIGTEAFKSLNLNHLTELIIGGSTFLRLASNSLVFSNTNVNVTIYRVEEYFHIPNIHSSISTIIMDEVKLNDFSTDSFVATGPVRFERSGYIINNIIIKNSFIKLDHNKRAKKEVEVNSITFDNTTFHPSPRYPFINLAVRTHTVFRNLNLEASNSEIITIKANDVTFENCTITNWIASAIFVKANNVYFYNTKIQEPQKHALMHIHPVDETIKPNEPSNTLYLINVTLDDPSQGTLATTFPMVEYVNIRVERCKCDLVEYLLEVNSIRTSQFVSSTANTMVRSANVTWNPTFQPKPRHEIEAELSDHILCHPRNDESNEFKWIHPEADCNGSKDHGNGGFIVGITIGLLSLALIISILVLLRWRKKVNEKVNLINKWEIHPPKRVDKGLGEAYFELDAIGPSFLHATTKAPTVEPASDAPAK